MDQAKPIRSGAALFGAGAALVGLTFALTGHASPSGPALLAWVALAGGALRILAGIWQWRAAARQAPAAQTRVQAQASEIVPEEWLPTVAEPVSAEPDMAPVEAEPELIGTPLEYDFWLLGLEPGVMFRQVKQAYWAARAACAGLSPQEAAGRQMELFSAYKRLRRIYQDSSAR